LVLSTNDSPWLYDLKKDPLEMINRYDEEAYKEIGEELMTSLKAQMIKYDEPHLRDTVNPLRYE